MKKQNEPEKKAVTQPPNHRAILDPVETRIQDAPPQKIHQRKPFRKTNIRFGVALLLLSAILHPLSSHAFGSLVSGTIIDASGAAAITNLTITSRSTPLIIGSNTIRFFTTNLLTDGNGNYSVNLVIGDYFAVIGSNSIDSFNFSVTNNGTSYRMENIITDALTYTQTAVPIYENKSNKNQTNGYPSLDGTGQIPLAEIPSSLFINPTLIATNAGPEILMLTSVNNQNTLDLSAVDTTTAYAAVRYTMYNVVTHMLTEYGADGISLSNSAFYKSYPLMPGSKYNESATSLPHGLAVSAGKTEIYLDAGHHQYHITDSTTGTNDVFYVNRDNGDAGVAGTVRANAFIGNGSGLTGVPSTTNAINVVTNDARAVSLSNPANTFVGNGSGLTGVPSTTNAINVVTNDARAVSLSNPANTFTGSGSNLTGVMASGFSNGVVNPGTYLLWSNNASLVTLNVYQSPASLSNITANDFLGIISTTASRNANGIWLYRFGTNYVAGQAASTNFNPYTGLPETNYFQNSGNTFQISVGGDQMSNNIGAKAGMIWGANNSVMVGMFTGSGQETTSTVWTNGNIYFLAPQSTNYDGQGDNNAKAFAVFLPSRITFTNNFTLGTQIGDSSGTAAFVVNGNQWNTAGRLGLLNGTVIDPNTPVSATNFVAGNIGDATKVAFDVTGNGSGMGMPANQSALDFWYSGTKLLRMYTGPNLVELQNGASISFGGGTGTIGSSGDSTATRPTSIWFSSSITGPTANFVTANVGTVTVTNVPTFKTTNAAPGGFVVGTTAPRIWIPFTNGSTVYLMPGY